MKETQQSNSHLDLVTFRINGQLKQEVKTELPGQIPSICRTALVKALVDKRARQGKSIGARLRTFLKLAQ